MLEKTSQKKELEKEYDAIIFATGSKKARDLNVKNRDCTGIYFAVDYLTKATKHLLDNTEEISAKYKHVVIVGVVIREMIVLEQVFVRVCKCSSN